MGWLITLGIIVFVYLAWPRRKVDVTLFDNDKIVTVDYTLLGNRYKQRVLIGKPESTWGWPSMYNGVYLKGDLIGVNWIDKNTGRTFKNNLPWFLANHVVRQINKHAALGTTQANKQWAQQQYDQAIEKWIREREI